MPPALLRLTVHLLPPAAPKSLLFAPLARTAGTGLLHLSFALQRLDSAARKAAMILPAVSVFQEATAWEAQRRRNCAPAQAFVAALA